MLVRGDANVPLRDFICESSDGPVVGVEDSRRKEIAPAVVAASSTSLLEAPGLDSRTEGLLEQGGVGYG